MSIDDRLRTGMEPVGGLPSVMDPAFVRAVAAKADHRHKVRRVTALSCAAALIVVAAVALPKALDAQRSDDVPPVDTPTPSPTQVTETWNYQPQDSPIDDQSWGSEGIPRASRLAPLQGTRVERFGPRVFRTAYPEWPDHPGPPVGRCDCAVATIGLRYGEVTVRSGFSKYGPGIRIDGTFEIQGDRVVFDFAGVGRSTFRWALNKDQRLSFTFLSAEPGSRIAGVPAEAALRMLLTAAPFGR